MGQQQLLLLVLGIVIVGIAVVAGIQAFSEGKNKAQQDAAVSDAMRVISDVQAWMLKPRAFGGGEGSTESPTFLALGYPTTSVEEGTYKTLNGCFTLSGSGENISLDVNLAKVTVTGSGDDAVESLTCTDDIATVVISGATTNDIQWSYTEE